AGQEHVSKSPRSRGHATTPLPPPPPSAPKTDKKQRSNSKTWAGHGADAVDKAAQSHHTEQINKLEQEFRKLKGELQASRQTEQELKSHICNLTNSERSLRPEVTLLRQSNVLLQSNAALEKKIRAEREARVSVEKQMAELQAQKMEDAANSAWNLASRQEHSETQMLRKRVKEVETEYKQLQLECQALQQYRCVERDAVAMLSTLSALQDKAQHLEYNLSAETRIKLDLFSALGDARRQLEIAQGKVLRQDREIGGMKQKIAEVMAVSPGVS
ncbi:hypothetical protein CRUP_009772, partial [Coryphaenoides rupestris]